MSKKLVFIYILSVIFVSLMVGLVYVFTSSTADKNALSINSEIEKIDNANLQKNNFTQKYSCNDDEYVINSNLVNNGFISLDKFCEITKSKKVGENTIEKDGFSFDATIDDFFVKVESNVTIVKLIVIAKELGFNYTTDDDANYILAREYATKRLIATGNTKNNYGATDTFKYDNTTLLQYDSEFETATAYKNLKMEGRDVEIDYLVKDSISYSYAPAVQSSPTTWNGEMMGLDKYKEYLEGLGKELNEVVVVSIGWGVNYNHEMFKGRILTEYARNFNLNSGLGENYIADDSPTGDTSFSLGVIAQYTPKNVKILPIKIFTAVSPLASNERISAFNYIEKLLDMGVNIKAVTYNYLFSAEPSEKNTSLYNFFTKLKNRGVAVFIPAGTGGYDVRGFDYNGRTLVCEPAYYDNVFTVSSLNKNGTRWSNSNYGKVDFCAPGTDIASCTNQTDRGYVAIKSTYVPAAHMCAVFALLYSNPEKNYTYDKVVNLCKTFACMDKGDLGKDVYYGFGMVDLRKLLGHMSIGAYQEFGVLIRQGYESQGNYYSNGASFGETTISYYNQKYDIDNLRSNSGTVYYSDIVTNLSMYVYFTVTNPSYKFKGWYMYENADYSNPTLLSTSESTILDVTTLKQHTKIGDGAKYSTPNSDNNKNCIFAVVETKEIDLNVTFIYKDVEKYTGFASFGTKLDVSYVDATGTGVEEQYTCGYLAEDQTFTFKVVANRKFNFSIKCENDSVVSKMVYLDDCVRIVKGQDVSVFSPFDGGIYVPAYGKLDELTIIIVVLI